ncbi:MAG TPA: hypothetical protein VMZ31_00680 [Phycisphaerae bacterium]|nr:hypothetical protein [Phycisphaerae bacterium]
MAKKRSTKGKKVSRKKAAGQRATGRGRRTRGQTQPVGEGTWPGAPVGRGAPGPVRHSGTIGPVGEGTYNGPVGIGVPFDPAVFGPQHYFRRSRCRVGLGWHRDVPDYRDTTLGRLAPKYQRPAETLSAARLRPKKGENVYPTVEAPSAEAQQEAWRSVVNAFQEQMKQTLPAIVDNIGFCSPVENQGHLGSCTAQSAAGMIEMMQNRAFGTYEDASRLFIYKATRKLLGWTGDTGAFLRTTMKALALFGAPPESECFYVIDLFDEEPDSYLYAYAANYKALQYMRHDPPGAQGADVLLAVKVALSLGYPVMFGFTVYSSLTEDACIPFPGDGDQRSGGHAVLAVGYQDDVQCPNAPTPGSLIIRNSWGPGWGGDATRKISPGYGLLPYDYVLEGLAADFWTCFKFDWVNSGQFNARPPSTGLGRRKATSAR